MADLLFEPLTHTYTLNGRVVPNVTRILEIMDDVWRIPADVLKAAADRGTAVHLACQLDDENDLDEASLDPEIGGYLEGWRRFRREMGFAPGLIEYRVYHSALNYCGTLDRTGLMGGKRVLLDIKSGASFPSHGPQTIAYKGAFERETGCRIDARYCVYLKADGRYELVHQTGKNDAGLFLACLTIFAEKESRK